MEQKPTMGFIKAVITLPKGVDLPDELRACDEFLLRVYGKGSSKMQVLPFLRLVGREDHGDHITYAFEQDISS